MNAIWIVLPILTLLMFELGLTLQTEDFKTVPQTPPPHYCRAGRPNHPTADAGICFRTCLPARTSVLYRHHTHSLLARRQLIQHLLHDSQRRRSIVRVTDGMQQHYYAVHYPRDYGIRHTLCRQQSGHRYPSPRRQPYHAEPGSDASSHCSRHIHEALPSANGRKDS